MDRRIYICRTAGPTGTLDAEATTDRTQSLMSTAQIQDEPPCHVDPPEFEETNPGNNYFLSAAVLMRLLADNT